MRPMCVRVTEEVETAVDKLAADAGVDRSDWLRSVISEAAGVVVEVPEPRRRKAEPPPPPCAHPRDSEKKLAYGVFCGLCGERVR